MTSHSVPSLSSPSHVAVDEPADVEDCRRSLQDGLLEEPVPWLQNAWWGTQRSESVRCQWVAVRIAVITSNDSYSQFPLSFVCVI